MIIGQVVAKNRAFGNNIIFYNSFFPFGGGDVPCVPPPWRRLCIPIFRRLLAKSSSAYDSILHTLKRKHYYVRCDSFDSQAKNS